MLARYLKIAFVIFTIISIILASLYLNILVQTGKTSTTCSDEIPVVMEYNETHNGSTTLFSKIVIYNNGSLPLNYLSGPEMIVYTGFNRTSTTNYTLSKIIPKTILPGNSETVYLNITISFKTEISYFCQIDYYVGNWKPNPFVGDYQYVKYFSGVHFEWNG
jgi:hypothetical protein